MQINYILLAHRNPFQVKQLINTLSTPNCIFYVHIDKGVNQSAFTDILSYKANVIFLSEHLREFGTWGDIGIVQATINAISKIVKDNRKGYCVLLSGQDYPLKQNSDIETFFKNHYGEHFISIFPIPNKNGWGIDGGLSRLTKYKINLTNKRQDFVQLPSIFEKIFYNKKNAYKLFRLLKNKRYSDLLKVLKKRKLPFNITHFGGGQWWALPIETIHQIIEFIETNPKYVNFHKDTLLPDEMFFHTILMNLKQKNNSIIIKPSVTYVNWTRKNTQLPVTFTKKDIEELKSATLKNYLFARKFNIEEDKEILNLIDQVLLRK